MEKTGSVHTDLVQSQKEHKMARDECTRMATEKNQMERKVEREHKAAMRYRQLFDESKTPLAMAQQEIQSLNKELEIYKRREDSTRKEVDVLERDKNLQLTQIQKVEEKVKVTEDEVKQQERVAYSLENELAQFKAETVKQRTTIYGLEKEREKYGVEASEQRTM